MACPRLGISFALPIRQRPSAICPQSRFSRPVTPSYTAVRHASHAEQGRANGPKDVRGKRLGAKKTAGELVVPGNIIFRQRGTRWHAGDNCGLGRDHTIYATQKGYVRYYRDPLRNPKKRYIGVVFEKHETLPVRPNEPRRRRLGMIAVPFKQEKKTEDGMNTGRRRLTAVKADGTVLTMSRNYMFKETNWDIGRAAERAGVKVVPFKKNDRWLAWKKRQSNAVKIEQLKIAQREKKERKKANKLKGLEIARAKGRQMAEQDAARKRYQ